MQPVFMYLPSKVHLVSKYLGERNTGGTCCSSLIENGFAKSALLCFSVISQLWIVLCIRKQNCVLNQQAEEGKRVENETQTVQGIY